MMPQQYQGAGMPVNSEMRGGGGGVEGGKVVNKVSQGSV